MRSPLLDTKACLVSRPVAIALARTRRKLRRSESRTPPRRAAANSTPTTRRGNARELQAGAHTLCVFGREAPSPTDVGMGRWTQRRRAGLACPAFQLVACPLFLRYVGTEIQPLGRF